MTELDRQQAKVEALKAAGWKYWEGRWWKDSFLPEQNTLTLDEAYKTHKHIEGV